MSRRHSALAFFLLLAATAILPAAADAQGVGFWTVAPCRLVDTRSGPALATGLHTFQASGNCAIPAGTVAVSLGIIAVDPTAGGHVTLFASGTPSPGTSNVNFNAGQTRAGNGVVMLSAGGAIDVVVVLSGSGATMHLILDTMGYFADTPPTAVDDLAAVDEDDPATAIDVLANDTDPDAGPKAIASATDPPNGTVVLTGGSPGAHTGLTYQPDANYCNNPPGTTPDTFTYTLTPGGDVGQVSVTVDCVNDAPAGTDNAVTTNEDTDHVFSAADFGFTDPNDTPPNALLAVKIATLPAAGVLEFSSIAVVAGQDIPAGSIGNLTFTPAPNAHGTPYTSFTFQVQDDGGTANGGVDLDASPNTLTVNVTSVNDPPSGADNTVGTNEDTAYVFAAGDFGFTDPSDTPANALLAVKIATLPGAGTLTLSNVSVSAGQDIPVGDVNGGLLEFDPAPQASGTPYASFTFQVQDNGGVLNGGVDLDPSANTMTINVTAVNDAPALDLDANDSGGTVGADYAVTFNENDPATLLEDPVDATITDGDDTNLLSLTVAITNPQDGAAEVSGKSSVFW